MTSNYKTKRLSMSCHENYFATLMASCGAHQIILQKDDASTYPPRCSPIRSSTLKRENISRSNISPSFGPPSCPLRKASMDNLKDNERLLHYHQEGKDEILVSSALHKFYKEVTHEPSQHNNTKQDIYLHRRKRSLDINQISNQSWNHSTNTSQSGSRKESHISFSTTNSPCLSMGKGGASQLTRMDEANNLISTERYDDAGVIIVKSLSSSQQKDTRWIASQTEQSMV